MQEIRLPSFPSQENSSAGLQDFYLSDQVLVAHPGTAPGLFLLMRQMTTLAVSCARGYFTSLLPTAFGWGRAPNNHPRLGKCFSAQATAA